MSPRRLAVNVQTGRVADAYLPLDQGMIMAALGNALGNDVRRRAFADRRLENALRPVIGVERFTTSRRARRIRRDSVGPDGDTARGR